MLQTHRAGKPRDGGPSPGLATVLAVALVLAFAGGAFAALAPPEESFEISAKELSGPAGQITLPIEWYYNPVDDPRFALRDVDHSLWPKADIRLHPGEVPDDWRGIGWFRLRFRVDPSLRGVPLGLLVHQLGAAEVYLDGDLLLTLGTVDPDPAKAVGYVQRRPHLFAFDDYDEHVLAVRYCHHDPTAYESLGRSGGFLITLSPANEGMTAWVRDAETLSAYQAFFTGVFAVFAILHLLLFAFYPEARENLFFALMSVAVAVLVYFFLENFFTTDPRFFHLYDRGTNTAWLLLSVFALRFVYGVFHPRVPRTFWVFAGVAAALLVPSWIWPLAVAPWIFVLVLVASVEMVRSVILGFGRRHSGAWFLGVGILEMAAGFAVGLLANLGVLESTILTAFLIPFSSVLLLMLMMSIYLSRRFATTSRELRRQLRAVEELSDQKIEQERKAREEEVQRALLEAKYEQKVQELEEARRLQLSMLPERLPELPGLEVAASMLTATEVGGDYYDFDLADDGTLTLAIGDATGHGMRAGTLVTATKSLFNALGEHHEDDLARTLERFGRALRRMNLRQLGMALTLARLKDDRLCLAAAGMPPALVYRAASGTVESVQIEGLPLGSLDGRLRYRQREIVLGQGDTVLLMSDGFPERLNRDDEMLGYDKAAETFSSIAAAPAAGVIRHLVEQSDVWAAGQPPGDDMTFVVLKRT